jgi:plastocyanin
MQGRAARAVIVTGLVVGAVVPASGCADDPPDARPAEQGGGPVGDGGDAPRASVTVQALDNSFRPLDLTVEVGTEVVFDNVGRNEHNVIPEPGGLQGWGVGEDLFAPGDTYAHRFDEPGVYEFVCTIHGVNRKGMVGTITVVADDGGSEAGEARGAREARGPARPASGR